MSGNKTTDQGAARLAQKELGCSYNAALLVARSEETIAEALEDKSPRPFRKKLADVVIKKLRQRKQGAV